MKILEFKLSSADITNHT